LRAGCDRTDANAMPAQDPDDICKPPRDNPMNGDPDIPAGLTLENIIDLTEEFEHLNELVMLHLEKEGGITSPESYFNAVHPILDLLEVEIRLRCHAGMGKQEMKLLIQDWIDEEIAFLKSGKKR
jgi:hypothetical protein